MQTHFLLMKKYRKCPALHSFMHERTKNLPPSPEPQTPVLLFRVGALSARFNFLAYVYTLLFSI